jgi:hypothetical protein
VYTSVVVAYSVFLLSNVSISDPVWLSGSILAAFALGSVGLPVVLWVRYRLWCPLVLMTVMLLFWHVLVEFPPIGSGQGDSPGFTFVFVFAPLYIVAYLLLGCAERWVQKRGADSSTSESAT